ncbi:PAS domain S-box protein [Algoriphagus litoralis]|uniref:PAS domain S-box protein n=1 Tax=Algoriphagus litoralis TaxID=2202829 RepID=UPI0018E4E97D|nr:PAS domain S-box protein [Algoriphagus litoralis]
MDQDADFPSFSIDRYRVLVEEALDIIYEIDVTGHFTFVNGMAVQLLGYSRAELLTMHYLDLIEPSYRENVALFYKYQIECGDKSSYLEFPVQSKEGKIEWIGQKVQLIYRDEILKGAIAIARIRTDRHNLENGLKLSEEKYRGILENLQFGLMEVDVNERILFVNDTMTLITGYSREELLGNVASDLLVRAETKEKIEEQHRLREKNKASAYEVELIRKDGSSFFGLISGAPTFDLTGRRTGSIGVHVDITERKKNELELRQIKKDLDRYTHGLESLNSITSDLSYTLERQLQEGLRIVSEYFEMPLGGVVKAVDDNLLTIQSLQNDTVPAFYQKALPIHKSVSGISYLEERLIAIPDLANSAYRDYPTIKTIGLKSMLSMPIYVNDRKFGAILLGSTSQNRDSFSDYDLQFFRLFARYAGFVLTSAENRQKLFEQQETLLAQNLKLSESQQFLSSINSFVTKLLDQDDIHSISWEIVENVIHNFGFKDCVIYILNEEKACLEQLAAYGPKDAGQRKIKDPIEVQFGKGIVGTVAMTGKAEIISDTSKDPRYISDDEVRLSEITVPILFENKVIGIIDSEHQDRNFFTDKHLETLTIISNLAAGRLKNAKSKRKQEKAEKELRESENKLRTVINSALDAIITIDDLGRIKEWNPQATQIFGWTQEEVVGHHLTENIIPNQHRKAHFEGMNNYMATGHGPVLNQRIEITALHKSGREFPIELSIIPLVTNGEHSFTAFARDITMQKNSKDEMEKALTKERELSELKSRFVSMTSHEFKTPLTTIKQNVDLIEYALELKNAELKPAFSTYFSRISSEISRVTSLMNDMLLLGKIEAGKVEITKKPTDLVALSLQLIQRITAGRMDGRSIQLNVIGVKQEVPADSMLMEHILGNLFTNALKYSEGKPDPKVTISFEILSHARILVKDFGIGIPAKDQKGLFSSFYRATNVKNIQGSGLGLSIAKEFIEMHGGTISVVSDTNQGSEFILLLPMG